jgi:hypothetical protein
VPIFQDVWSLRVSGFWRNEWLTATVPKTELFGTLCEFAVPKTSDFWDTKTEHPGSTGLMRFPPYSLFRRKTWI